MSKFLLWIVAIIIGSGLISVHFGGLQMPSYIWGALITFAYYELVKEDSK